MPRWTKVGTHEEVKIHQKPKKLMTTGGFAVRKTRQGAFSPEVARPSTSPTKPTFSSELKQMHLKKGIVPHKVSRATTQMSEKEMLA